MAAGSVVVELLMRTGQFETDTDRATKILNTLDKSINRQVATLKLQAAQLGKTTREAKLYELALQGATPAQLKAAESALAQVEAHGKLQKAQQLGAKALLAIGVGAVAAAVAFDKLISSTGDFKDLEEQTGATAEDLASLAVPAAVAGTSVEALAGQMNKLTKSLAGVDDDSKAVGAALTALGIPIKDFKKLDPVAQIDALTKGFNSLGDGSGKSAIAMALFGKSGASILNVFKELESQGGRQIVLTQRQIELADAYSDNQKRLVAQLLQYGQVVAVEILPAVTSLSGVLIDLAKDFFHAETAATDLTKGGSAISDWADEGALYIAKFVDSLRGASQEIKSFAASTQSEFAFLNVGFAALYKPGALKEYVSEGNGPLADALRERKQILADAAKTYADSVNFDPTKAQDKLKKNIADRKDNAANERQFGFGKRPGKPQADYNGPEKVDDKAAAARSAELKKSLDGELRLIQDFGRSQADTFRFSQQMLDGAYSSGQISQADYFAKQKQGRDDALADQLATIDEEIAALDAFARNPLTKPADRIGADDKIKLSQQQRAEAVTKASNVEILATQANARAVEQLQDRYDDLLATVMSGAGDDFGATQLKNAKQVRDAERLMMAAKGAEGDPAVIEQLKQQLDYRAQAAQQQKEYSALLEQTQARESEIYLDAVAGGKGELQTLAAIRDARMQAIGLLRAQAVAAAELAALSGNADDAKRAHDLALALKQAAAEIDPLATKFNNLFEDSFSNAFSGFLTGAKSAKEAFKDFAASVMGEIANIAAKNLAKQVFGDTGGSSGIGGALSSLAGLFGGGKGTATNTTGTSLPTAGGASGGTNFVERDMLTILHKGEAVVPKAYNPVSGGGGVTIINQASGVQVRPAGKDSDGNPRLIVEQILDQASQRGAADFQSGNGPMAMAARGRLGLGAGTLPKRG